MEGIPASAWNSGNTEKKPYSRSGPTGRWILLAETCDLAGSCRTCFPAENARTGVSDRAAEKNRWKPACESWTPWTTTAACISGCPPEWRTLLRRVAENLLWAGAHLQQGRWTRREIVAKLYLRTSMVAAIWIRSTEKARNKWRTAK